jgi:hypothetical protein
MGCENRDHWADEKTGTGHKLLPIKQLRNEKRTRQQPESRTKCREEIKEHTNATEPQPTDIGQGKQKIHTNCAI